MKKTKWIYVVQSPERCALVATQVEAQLLKINEPDTMIEKMHRKGCLEAFSKVVKERERIKFRHTDETGRPYEINSKSASIQYTMYWPEGVEQRMHEPYGDLFCNSVGVFLREARYLAKCTVRYYRYTFYSGTEIPRELLKDPKDFVRLMETEKNRKHYKVFLIQETLDENCERLHQIIYANVKLYDDLSKNSNF